MVSHFKLYYHLTFSPYPGAIVLRKWRLVNDTEVRVWFTCEDHLIIHIEMWKLKPLKNIVWKVLVSYLIGVGSHAHAHYCLMFLLCTNMLSILLFPLFADKRSATNHRNSAFSEGVIPESAALPSFLESPVTPTLPAVFVLLWGLPACHRGMHIFNLLDGGKYWVLERGRL